MSLSTLDSQQCVCITTPAQFYRKFENELSTMKLQKLSRDKHLSKFVVKLILEALTAIDDKGIHAGTGNDKEITLDSDSSDDTCFDFGLAEFGSTYLLPAKTREAIERILIFASHAKHVRGLGLDRKLFVAEFCLAVEFPTLELLWILDSKFQLMSISSYLLRLKASPKLGYFARQVLSFCFSSCLHSVATSAIATEILNDILRSIIICGYCSPVTEECLQSLKSVSINILTGLTKKLFEDEDDHGSLNRKFLIVLLQEASVVHSIKRRYFSEQALVLLALPSNQTLTDALQYQEKIAAEEENEKKRSTISLYLGAPQTKRDVVEILRQALKDLSGLNWENVLHVISTWDKMYSPHSSEIFILMRNLIRALISIGLSEEKEDEVMAAFLLARHCCLISPQNFSRYEKWFSNMFGDEKAVTITPEKFTFLITTMTKWIPIEPPTFLQVHVSYRPFIPNGCRTLWSDYSAIARARISEYNEIEAAMEYEPNLKDPVQHEVEMAIKEFDSSGKIPKSISQMPFFQKQHYLNDFLPALMRKPTGAVLSDARLRLIEALNIDGKVPPNNYATYKSSMRK